MTTAKRKLRIHNPQDTVGNVADHLNFSFPFEPFVNPDAINATPIIKPIWANSKKIPSPYR
ncbi:hypothetical protein [uncultured Paenibacillus sp.]|uniref:hypothetical protein n=1 Tax=uncultured Paenibacillus sp. TaxID=227322 RepID=UPI00280553FE|nr:hypothetical protein [uncultured Paenibacillus sp.]